MKKILIYLLLTLSVSVQAVENTYNCRAEGEQCTAGDKKCSAWGLVSIEGLILNKKFTATFFSEDDEECENCESADYTYEAGNVFASDKKKFNLFVLNTPKVSLVTKKSGELISIILSENSKKGATYTHLYKCKLVN